MRMRWRAYTPRQRSMPLSAGVPGEARDGVPRLYRSVPSVLLPVLTDDEVRKHVHDKRQKEEQQTNGEETPEFDRPLSRVAKRCLHDVRGHRLDRLEWIRRQLWCSARSQCHDHGLADCTADGEDKAGDDAADGSRQQDLSAHLHSCSSQGVCPLRETGWYGAKCVFTEDRKSTRLNSSHLAISYAVFCL